MAIKPLTDIKKILGNKYESYTGDYFNKRLDATFAEDLTPKELKKLKERSVVKNVSVQNSLNRIQQSLQSSGWDLGIDESGEQLVLFPQGHPELALNYGLVLETGAGLIEKNGHQEVNNLVYYKSSNGNYDGICTLQEAEFDTLASEIEKKGGKIQALINKANADLAKNGIVSETTRRDLRKYFYPARSVGNTAPLNLSASKVKELIKETEKELGITGDHLNDQLTKLKHVNYGVRIRQMGNDYARSTQREQQDRRSNEAYQDEFEGVLKSIFIQIAVAPGHEDEIIKAVEKNPQYSIVTKSSHWNQIRSELKKTATITPITFTNTSETAITKGKATIGRSSSITPGQEHAQLGTKGSKAGNQLLRNVGNKRKAANVKIGNVSASTKNYSNSINQQNSGRVGLYHGRSTDHTSGGELRKILIDNFVKAGKNANPGNISKKIWMDLAQKYGKTKEMKSALSGELDEKARKKLIDEILPSEDFLFGRDYEQILVADSIGRTTGRRPKNLLTSIRNVGEKEIDPQKVSTWYKKILLNRNKKSLKTEEDKTLFEKFYKGEEALSEDEFKKIDQLIDAVEKDINKRGDMQLLNSTKQAAYRKVLGLKGDSSKYFIEETRDAEDPTKVIAQINEYAQLQTGEKIAFESGLHGVVVSVKDIILAQALLNAGFTKEEIFDSNGNLKVHALSELKTGSRKLGENIPSIINEFTHAKAEIINSLPEKSQQQEYKKVIKEYSANFKKYTKHLNPIFKQLGISSDQFVEKYFKNFENGEFVLGNFDTIIRELVEENDNFSSLSEKDRIAIEQGLPLAQMQSFIKGTGDASSFTTRNGGIYSKNKNGYIALEGAGIQDTATYFDPERKGGRAVRFGYKAMDDLEREVFALVASGTISKEEAGAYLKGLRLMYQANTSINKVEANRASDIIHNLIDNSKGSNLSALMANGNNLIESLANEKINNHIELEQKSVNGQRGFLLSEFENSIFGDIYKAQQEGKDVYFDYQFDYIDEKGNTIQGDAIQFLNYAKAFDLIEGDDGNKYLVPKDNAEGLLALDNISTMEGLFHTKRSEENIISQRKNKKDIDKSRLAMSNKVVSSFKEMIDSVDQKDSTKYKKIHDAELAHSTFSRIVSGGDEGVLSRGAAAIVSTDKLRKMLKMAAGEDEEGYREALIREARRLHLDVTEKDDINTIINKIVAAVDIDSENFNAQTAQGILNFLTRFPLLSGENIPIVEMFASSKSKLGDSIMVDSQMMDLLNADVDGDTIATALANLRSEFKNGNISEEEYNTYSKILEEELKMFRERSDKMKKFNLNKSDQKEESKPIISLEDFASRGNPLAATAAEIATRRNREQIGPFDQIRQGYLNAVKGGDFENTIEGLFASEFFTTLSQDAISSKKIFEKLLNKYGNKEELASAMGIDANKSDEDFLNDVVTNIGKEIKDVLNEKETFTTEAGWKNLGRVLAKWGVADLGTEQGDIAFSETRTKVLAARLAQLTGDDSWLTNNGQFTFDKFGEMIRKQGSNLQGRRVKGVNGNYIDLKDGLFSIVANPYAFLPGTHRTNNQDLAINPNEINKERLLNNEYNARTLKSLEEVTADTTTALKGLTSAVESLLESFKKANRDSGAIFQAALENTGYSKGVAVTTLTRNAGINSYNAPSLANDAKYKLFEALDRKDSLLGFQNIESRDAFLKEVMPSIRGDATNIGQLLLMAQAAGVDPSHLSSIKAFESFVNSEEGASYRDAWYKPSITTDNFKNKVFNSSLGSHFSGNESILEITDKLKDIIRNPGTSEADLDLANQLALEAKELGGGPAEILKRLKMIDKITGSNYYQIATRNIGQMIKANTGRTALNNEMALGMTINQNLGENGVSPFSIYGFADLFFKNEKGGYTLTDIKTASNNKGELKPEYITQVMLYATLLKNMKGKDQNQLSEIYKRYWHRDLTDSEYKAIQEFDPDKLDIELQRYGDDGSVRFFNTSYNNLMRNGGEAFIQKVLASGNPDVRNLLAQDDQLKAEASALAGNFIKLSDTNKYVEGSSTEEEKKSLKDYLAILKKIYELKAEIQKLDNSNLESADKLRSVYEKELDSLTKGQNSKKKIYKELSKEDQKEAKKAEQRLEAEFLYEQEEQKAKEEKALLRELDQLYKQNNRNELALYKNANQRRMTANQTELSALKEQELALLETNEPIKKRISEIEKILGSDKVKKLQEEAQRLLQLGYANEDVRNKGQNTFWGQLGGQINRLFTNFIRFGAVSKIMQTVRRDIQKVVQATKELDKAMTNIRIVTGKTADEAKDMINSYAKLANQIGVTTTEVAASANEWFNKMSRSLTNKLL